MSCALTTRAYRPGPPGPLCNQNATAGFTATGTVAYLNSLPVAVMWPNVGFDPVRANTPKGRRRRGIVLFRCPGFKSGLAIACEDNPIATSHMSVHCNAPISFAPGQARK
jgi:hypothetical protein